MFGILVQLLLRWAAASSYTTCHWNNPFRCCVCWYQHK